MVFNAPSVPLSRQRHLTQRRLGAGLPVVLSLPALGVSNLTRKGLNYTSVIWQPLRMAEQLSPVQARHLARRIRAFGLERGLASDRAIAGEARLAPKAIRAIETGPSGPTLSTLLALCRGLRVYSVDQLLGFSATNYFERLEHIETALGGMITILYREIDEPLE